MTGYLVLFSFTVLVCKVHSQLCSPPILPPACPAACVPVPCPPTIPPCPVTSPQVINPNPYVTTIIDNSVSNALVNALQLLIVSNLIGAAVGPSAPLLNNLGPLLDSLVCSPCPVEIVIPEYVTYGSNYDLIPPYSPITCGPYYDIIPPCGPITTCGPNYEIIPPCGPIIDPYIPPLCGLTDLISPNYFTYTETVSPICIDPYSGYGDLLFPICGLETITPNYYGGLTEIIPNYINYPIPEICPPQNPFYGGFAETITPAVAAFPNMFGCLNEVVAPCLSTVGNIYAPEPPFGLAGITPNYYGGLTELTAEVLLPPTIPSPLTCNYGYSPSSLPCVRVNVDPYENCIYNGYNGPIYY